MLQVPKHLRIKDETHLGIMLAGLSSSPCSADVRYVSVQVSGPLDGPGDD